MQPLPFERSWAVEDMVAFLVGLTVGVDDGEGLPRLNDKLDEISTFGINPQVAKVELALLKFCAISIGLLAFQDVRNVHGDKIDKVERAYLAEFRSRGQGSADAFLQLSQTRLAAYTAAFDGWCEAQRDGRGSQRTFAVGQTFFFFCGIENNDPVALLRFGNEFSTIVRVVHDRLMNCKLK